MLASAASAAPVILESRWGVMRVSNVDSRYKDAKVWPSGSREWDWRETGTRHSPGVQIADIEELFRRSGGSLEAVVISRGMDSMLQVPEATIEYAEGKGAKVFALPTPEAVEKYNALARSGARVAGVFHSTC